MEEMKTEVDRVTSSRGAQWAGAGSLIALAAGSLLGNGGLNLGGILGGCNQQTQMANAVVQNALATKDAEIALLKSEKYADQAVLGLYKYIDGKSNELNTYLLSLDKRVAAIETAAPLREQIVQNQITCCCNAANAAIAQLQATVAGLTKTVIPAANVCPQPMPQYNSWTAPTTTTTTTAS